MAAAAPQSPDSTVARPAATVMLVRDAQPDGAAGFDGPTAGPGHGLEVLMVRRNLRSDFVGGAYVFPGGAVDPDDGGAEAEAICVGRTDAEASSVLGLPSQGLAYWVAVLRECFEEAGVLLATHADGTVLSLHDPDEDRRFAAHRRGVNDGTRRFLDVCREEGLRLAVDRVHYFAHWITPEGAPRRYDTRFFVAAAPVGQTPVSDLGETIAEEWIAPAEALRRHREGEIELIFPTIRNLQAISRFSDSASLLRAAAEASSNVPTVVPRVVRDGGTNGVRIVLPGDPGYDGAEQVQTPAGADPAAVNEAIRAISREANTAPGPDPTPAAGA